MLKETTRSPLSVRVVLDMGNDVVSIGARLPAVGTHLLVKRLDLRRVVARFPEHAFALVGEVGVAAAVKTPEPVGARLICRRRKLVNLGIGLAAARVLTVLLERVGLATDRAASTTFAGLGIVSPAPALGATRDGGARVRDLDKALGTIDNDTRMVEGPRPGAGLGIPNVKVDDHAGGRLRLLEVGDYPCQHPSSILSIHLISSHPMYLISSRSIM